MEHLKCKIGATILAPTIFGVFISILVFICRMMEKFKWFEIFILVAAGLGSLVWIVGMWLAIYDFCKDKHSKKSEKG